MDVSNQSTAKAAAVIEDPEPPKQQHLREHGRSNSSNSPVLVYDCEQKTVQVLNKKNVGKLCASIIHWLAS